MLVSQHILQYPEPPPRARQKCPNCIVRHDLDAIEQKQCPYGEDAPPILGDLPGICTKRCVHHPSQVRAQPLVCTRMSVRTPSAVCYEQSQSPHRGEPTSPFGTKGAFSSRPLRGPMSFRAADCADIPHPVLR